MSININTPELANVKQLVEKKTPISNGLLIGVVIPTFIRAGAGRDECVTMIQQTLGSQFDPSVDQEQLESLVHSDFEKKSPTVEVSVQSSPLTEVLGTSNTVLHDAGYIIPAEIPRRKWILGRRYAKGYPSMSLSPGGRGKSLVGITDAIAIATGVNLLGDEVVEQGNVWYYNTEDPRDEIQMRVAAICQHHGIDLESLKGKVKYSSGRDAPLELVSYTEDGRTAAINEDTCRMLINVIQNHKIKALILDPLIKTHSVSENSNSDMDLLMRALTRIAEEADCAVMVIHHSRKAGTSEKRMSMDDGRGASAVACAARIIDVLNAMTSATARELGIEEKERWRYVELACAKRNMSPSESRSRWFRKEGVEIANGEQVGAIEVVDFQLKPRIDELAEFITNSMFEIMQTGESVMALSEIVRNVAAETKEAGRDDWKGLTEPRIRTRIESLLRVKGLQRDGFQVQLLEKAFEGSNSKYWIELSRFDNS
jgi:hypothetical protein